MVTFNLLNASQSLPKIYQTNIPLYHPPQQGPNFNIRRPWNKEQASLKAGLKQYVDQFSFVWSSTLFDLPKLKGHRDPAGTTLDLNTTCISRELSGKSP
jgi:hypothetical protein